MTVVLDASVTMAWCFLDEATAETWAVLERIRNEGALVPAIWPLEVANVMLSGQRRGRLTQAATAHFIALLDALPVVVEPITGARAFGPILTLANAHSLSAYDASYLELAMRKGLPLASRDERLREVARAVGVTLLE